MSPFQAGLIVGVLVASVCWGVLCALIYRTLRKHVHQALTLPASSSQSQLKQSLVLKKARR